MSNYSTTVLARNPVAYWRLGEANGSRAHDKSGNGHTGTYFGGPMLQEPGALSSDDDTAVRFDSGSYVEVHSHAAFSQPTSGDGLTVEAWLRPDALEFEGVTDDPYIYWLSKGQAGQQEWALRFYSSASPDRPNRISAYIFNPDTALGAGAYFQDEVTPGEWIHVVACYDPGDADTPGAGVQIYQNGVRRLGPPSSGTLYSNPKWEIRPVAGTAPLRFGTRDRKTFFIGALDEVAIYPRVLTAAEILENYNAGSAGF